VRDALRAISRDELSYVGRGSLAKLYGRPHFTTLTPRKPQQLRAGVSRA